MWEAGWDRCRRNHWRATDAPAGGQAVSQPGRGLHQRPMQGGGELMYGRILLATDGSRASSLAIAHAVALSSGVAVAQP